MIGKKMSLVGHLDELRRRLILCFIAAFVGLAAAYYCYDPWIFNFLKGPLDALSGKSDNPFVFANPLLRFLKSVQGEAQGLDLKLHFIGPMEGFMMKIKASFFAGVIAVSHFILYQVWGFVSGGLTRKERRAVRLFLPVSLVLFLCGILVAYFVMVPVALYFLVVVGGKGLEPTLIMSKYVSLLVLCALAFGVIFEMPLVIFFLTKLGIVSPDLLIKKRKYAILLMFIVAAVLTPPDIITQVMMALPMMALYEVSIWIAKVTWARRQKAMEV